MLRGFKEGVKDEDVFGSTTMTESERITNEGHTVFTADVKTAFLNGHMKDDVVYAKPPPEWQTETLGQSK